MAPDRLRVLCVGRDLKGGGAERLQLTLLQELATEVEITVAYMSSDGELYAGMDASWPVTYCASSGAGLKWMAPSALWKITRLLGRHDIVFAMQDATPAYVAGLAASLTKKPSVVWLHSLWPACMQSLARWHLQAAARLYPTFDRVVTVSEVAAASLTTWLPRLRRKTEVVPNFIDIGRTETLARCALPLEWRHLVSKGPLIVVVGRLVAQKRVDLTIRAVAELVRHEPTVRVAVVGDGPERKRLEALSETLGVAQTIHFCGYQSNPFPFVRAATAICMPSRDESFGMVALEGLALGKAVVTCDDSGGTLEVIDGGRLGHVSSPRPEALASALKRALLDVRGSTSTSRQHVERFALRNAVPRFVDILAQAARPLAMKAR